LVLIALSIVGYTITYFLHINVLRFFVIAIVINALAVYISLPLIKKIAKGLTVDDTIDPTL